MVPPLWKHLVFLKKLKHGYTQAQQFHTCANTLKQWFSHINVQQNHWESLLNTDCWIFPPRLSNSGIGAWKFAFLRSSRWCWCYWSGDGSLRTIAIKGTLALTLTHQDMYRILIMYCLHRKKMKPKYPLTVGWINWHNHTMVLHSWGNKWEKTMERRIRASKTLGFKPCGHFHR